MADITLTPQQSTAVNDRGGALLVSAAAGSGKTKVLVERLFAYMAQEHCHVDDFLIITYTKAAASELRGKIAEELSRRVGQHPEDAHLRRQLFRVYQADIKTVDAFCGAMLRQNVHLLPAVEGRSLTPDFRVLDKPEADLLRVRVLQRVLDGFYEKLESGDEDARLLAETLGFGRDDRALESLVLQLHEKIQSHPYPLNWLRKMGKNWENLPEDLSQSEYGRILMEQTVRRAEFWAARLEREVEDLADWPEILDKYGPGFLDVASQLRRYRFAAQKGWDAMSEVAPVFPRLGSVRDKSAAERKDRAKALWDGCKKEIKEKLSPPYRITSAEHLEDLAAMAPAIKALVALTEDFSAAYQAEKVRRNCMDFSDQEHYAVDLLQNDDGTPTELARQIASRYREVMVDEYQDSNEVQNCIFHALSDEGRNLFVVGDVKQSIYRFRLADPTIFLRKYNDYPSAAEAEKGQPRKVLLQSNFRSRQQVLRAVNFVFSGVLSRDMGEMDYGPDEQLNFGADYYLPRSDADTEFHLISVENTEEETVDRTETEARFVARRIRQMLDEGYPVQDGKDFRPVKPEDIVILMRAPAARMRAYAAAMARENIPFAGDEDQDFFSTVEIAVLLSFLEIIDNPRQDVPLISVLRSPLFGFTPDRLAQIRALQPTGDYYEALCLDESEDTVAFRQTLDELRQAARDLKADGLLWRIYTDCHALAIFGAMEGGEQRKNNLLALFTYAGDLAAGGKGSLFDFVTHLRRLLDRDDKPKLSTRQSSGGVRLMTIHKSKGLEFPVVFLTDLQKDFNRNDLKEAVLVHPELGLGPDCVDRERRIRYDTAAKTAISMVLERENKAEEMRILYVAMTRAKEKLILVDCMKGARKHVGDLIHMASYPADPEAVAACGSLGDWVLLPLVCAAEGESICRWAGLTPPNDRISAPGWSVHVWENPAEEAAQTGEKAVERAEAGFDPAVLSYTYAHQRSVTIPTKITATQLKGRELDREIAEGAPAPNRTSAFEKPRFLQKERKLNGTERGTAMHLAMQFIDLAEPDEAAVARQIADLRERHLMTPEQAEAVDCAAIAAFLRSPLGRRAAAAETVYREYRFTLLMSAALYDPAAEGEEMLLQGVVDCAFDTPEGLVIVDFKTDRILPGGEEARAKTYRPQLEAYAAARKHVLERPVAEKRLWFFATGREISL